MGARGFSLNRSPTSALRNIVLVSLVALLPVAFLSTSSIVLASRQVTSEVDQQVQTTAAVSSVVIGQQTSNLKALLTLFATRHSLITNVSGGVGADTTIQTNLENLAEASPGISASFVASLSGTSLATYPPESSIHSTNFA